MQGTDYLSSCKGMALNEAVCSAVLADCQFLMLLAAKGKRNFGSLIREVPQFFSDVGDKSKTGELVELAVLAEL